MHDFFEDHGVHVLTQHVEQEPVTHVGLLDDGVDDFPPDESEPDVEQVGTHLGADDDDQPVQYYQGTQHCQQNEPAAHDMTRQLRLGLSSPEPKKNVDLLVNNI